MGTVPTVVVRHPDDPDVPMIINASDYEANPAAYERWEDSPADPHAARQRELGAMKAAQVQEIAKAAGIAYVNKAQAIAAILAAEFPGDSGDPGSGGDAE